MGDSANIRSTLLLGAAISGATAVAIGAFGAHGLKGQLTDYELTIFEKGVQYQFYHTLACALAGMLMLYTRQQSYFQVAGYCFLAGIICFSGSLYVLACRSLTSTDLTWVGPITPIGGVLFIAGWVLLALGIRRHLNPAR